MQTGDAPIEVKVSFSGRFGPVSGTVLSPGGTEIGFHGWLELMDALESSRGGTRGRAAVPAPAEPEPSPQPPV